MPGDVLIIGGGLTGLSCAITLAEQGIDTTLIEASPRLGGRTSSFYERRIATWADNGPHLLIGAYAHTRAFLQRCKADHLIEWQHTLELPLWDSERGFFHLKPHPRLPLPLALLQQVYSMPGHRPSSALGMLRLSLQKPRTHESVAQWLQRLHIPAALIRDLLEPLCLGAMNEPVHSANGESFARVLRESFSSHEQARLGWFTAPLSCGLIPALECRARQCGVRIHTGIRASHIDSHHERITTHCRHGQRFVSRRVVLAVPPWQQGRLTGQQSAVATQPITNIHLWFRHRVQLPRPFVGGIGTKGQWFFDISAQMQQAQEHSHLCVVISAACPDKRSDLIADACRELSAIIASDEPLLPYHARVVCERRATTLVRATHPRPALPDGIINAMEYPQPGGLPATIEYAIERGTHSAETLAFSTF